MMHFVSHLAPAASGLEGLAGDERAYWFIFQDDKLLVRQTGDRVLVPVISGPPELGLNVMHTVFLGHVEEDGKQTECYAAEVDVSAPLPDGMTFEGLRALYPLLDEPLMNVAGRAVQLVAFNRTHQFCGQCGARMIEKTEERARRCPRCGLVSYPRLSPAIIVAVVRRIKGKSHILLAHSHRFPQGPYSVLAGFVEPGESLEECVVREVCEEVGISLQNIRYFGSQSWPFPNSLMIGFTAEYEAGEITPQESELADARWFAVDQLPNIPPPHSIARRLINWWIAAATSSRK
jgi:NAD+ diphosphatase